MSHPLAKRVRQSNLPVMSDIARSDEAASDEAKVRAGFWAKARKTLGRVPFSEDVVAAFHCATDGATPLARAAKAADIPMMKALLDGGANPAINTEEQASPLMFAAGFGRVPGESRVTEESALEALELCRQLGLDVKQAEAGGDTALHAVAFYGWVKVGQ